MGALDAAMASNIMNATLPTGAGGIPGSFTALAASAMKLRLNSTLSTASAAGTELTGTGYTAGGTSITTASTASSAGSNVTLPNVSGGLSWTNGSGGAWSIASLDLTSSAGVRSWFGPFTGQPVSVANGNTFNVAQNAVTCSLS
jgi:hypothetical protein